MIYLTDADYIHDHMKAPEGRRLLLVFSAEWCRPCRLLSPILEGLEQERDDLVVAKVDADSNPVLMDLYEVGSVPTLVLLDDDAEPVARVVGARPKARLVKELGL